MPDPIEIQVPSANDARSWNEAIVAGAEKAGVELPKALHAAAGEQPVAAAAAVVAKKDDEPTMHEIPVTINGTEMIFRDADPANVLKQVAAALEAARLAQPVVAAAKVEEKNLSAADMFDVGTKLISGDASGLDTLLEKSGAFERYLEKQGLDIGKLKAATEKSQSDTVHDQWKTATDQFNEKVKSGEIDYPGGPQNMKMMGYTLARLGLKPSLDSMEKAWAEMKKEGLVFAAAAVAEKTAVEKAAEAEALKNKKKDPPGSTAVGAAAGGGKPGGDKPVIDANRKFEIDMSALNPRQYTEAYNTLIAQGVKPEQIVVK